jgi:hypothetical protein
MSVTRLQASTEVLNSSSRIALEIPANVSKPSKSLKIALAKGNPHKNRHTAFLSASVPVIQTTVNVQVVSTTIKAISTHTGSGKCGPTALSAPLRSVAGRHGKVHYLR